MGAFFNYDQKTGTFSSLAGDRERARQRQERTGSIFGAPSQPESQSPYQMADMESFDGEQPIAGLMSTNPATRATGLFENLPERYVPQMRAAKELAMSEQGDMQEQGFSMLDDILDNQSASDRPRQVDRTTFAFGAGNGKMQRGYLGEEGGLVPIGQPYAPRNPYLNTGTSFVNPYEPQRNININNKAAAEQTQEGKSGVISQYKRIDDLKTTKGGRWAGMKKAQKFYNLIDSGKMSSGGMRKALSVLPFTFTKQGKMDEEFNAFSETAARQALKANGEIRPTDEDVKGMKQAMFGIGRDESVNKTLLQDFINSIEHDDHEGYLLGISQKYNQSQGNRQDGKIKVDKNGNRAMVFPDGTFKVIQ